MKKQYNKHMSGKVYDFIEFRKSKPFFTKPMRITVQSNTLIDTYFLLENIVYKGKQILALINEQSPCSILLAEGKIENGILQCLIKLPDDTLSEISALFNGENKNTIVFDNK